VNREQAAFGQFRALVEVDRAALAANVRGLRQLAGELWVAVKADGYGHGAVVAAQAAIAGGAKGVCVACLEEAESLSKDLPGVRIMVLGPLPPGREERAGGLDVVVSSADAWCRLAAVDPPARVHLKIDTGMARWGLGLTEAPRIIEQARGSRGRLRLEGVMSHLSSAESDFEYTRDQIRRFREMSQACPGVTAHLANSAGLLYFPEARFDAARCGIAAYGVSPRMRSPDDDGLVPGLRWLTVVREIRQVGPGTSVGYGRRLEPRRRARVAVASVGYADGYPRGLAGQAEVLIRGRRHRVEANVSMDALIITLSEPGGPDVRAGDRVTLLGTDGHERITVEELAGWAGTIGNEVLTNIRVDPGRGVARTARGPRLRNERLIGNPQRVRGNREARIERG
jgi:alanine racemase